MELSQWTKAHFSAYIFLSIADADEDMDKKEVEKMQDFLEDLHFEYDNAYELLKSVRETHRKHPKDLRVNFITTKHNQFLDSDEELLKIVDRIEELILADNSIDRAEIKMYSKIRKALKIDDGH